MHDIVKLDLKANIHDENDHIAQHVKEHMTEDNVLVINVMEHRVWGKPLP